MMLQRLFQLLWQITKQWMKKIRPKVLFVIDSLGMLLDTNRR